MYWLFWKNCAIFFSKILIIFTLTALRLTALKGKIKPSVDGKITPWPTCSIPGFMFSKTTCLANIFSSDLPLEFWICCPTVIKLFPINALLPYTWMSFPSIENLNFPLNLSNVINPFRFWFFLIGSEKWRIISWFGWLLMV